MNPWPRPLQQPHPAIWIPGAGSLETMEFVARHRYAYMGIPYFHLDVFKRNFSMFRDACEAEGYEADPLQLGWLVPIYVAETDEQARARVRGAPLVLREAAAARHHDPAARLHVGALARAAS